MADPKPPLSPAGSVSLRNATRGTLTFRVPGRSVRLFPGQVTELPHGYLDGSELSRLHKQGSLVLVKPAPAAALLTPPAVASVDGGAEKKGQP